jgi:hypothetical protein
MRVLDVLIKARSLIKDQNNWTQNAFARDDKGRRFNSIDKNAVSFCAIGACYKVSDPDVADKATMKLHKSAMTMFSQSVELVNDDLGHAEIMKVFDRAIVLEILETVRPTNEVSS